MPQFILRLRFWFAIGAVLMSAMVAGAYLYAKWSAVNALKQVPEKIDIKVQQSAEGFTISKSEGGRTIFTVKASKAVQYREGGRAELHDVNIIIYGKDSTRFDQIYGSDFVFDPKSGDVQAKGEVQIDLEANPAGLTGPDQAPPRELKNPIHLKTSGLVFNQKTGDAHTEEQVEFSIPQARGWAVGVNYTAKDAVLKLHSQVHIVFNGANTASVDAARATISKNPHVVVLEQVHAESANQRSAADKATMFLRDDNTVERVLAEGRVTLDTHGEQKAQATSDQLEVALEGKSAEVRSAILRGNVHAATAGDDPMEMNAERVVLSFLSRNLLSTVRTEGEVHLLQHQRATSSSGAQDLELTAPIVTFDLAKGRHLKQAETSGPPQIAFRPASGAGQRTMVTSEKFNARFNNLGQLESVHGAPEARIVSTSPGQPERISTSSMLDATFRPGSGIDSITQQGNVAYRDGDRKAWGDRAVYIPATQVLTLSGSPRIEEGGMTTTASLMRLNRATGAAIAEGGVKSTYSDLKPQPGGALLASASPIHVTAKTMTANRTPAVALYTGNARLWQDSNLVQAPSIEFDRDHRSMVAHGTPRQPVSTALVQSNSKGDVTPITITSSELTYADAERKVQLQGTVSAKSVDMSMTSNVMDIFLHPREQNGSADAGTPGKIERVVAQGGVVVVQGGRRATGSQLAYTSSDDKFVMTGNSPSIFDAELGKITGVSLTFYRADDTVLVEGSDSAPTVTRTRVAR